MFYSHESKFFLNLPIDYLNAPSQFHTRRLNHDLTFLVMQFLRLKCMASRRYGELKAAPSLAVLAKPFIPAFDTKC